MSNILLSSTLKEKNILMDTSTAILTCILSSTAATALITSIKELVIWWLNRKAKKADDAVNSEVTELRKVLKDQQEFIKKMTETIESMQKKLDIYLKDYKIILKDKIKYLVSKYVQVGEISLDEKQAIQHMWNTYHYDLGGNGDLDDYMGFLDEIPLKNLKGE